MSELIRKNASELVDLLKSGQVSSVELTQAHLDRSAAVDQDVHSYLYQNPETALAAAADIDRRRAAGEKLHELAGLPIAVKDNLTTTDAPTYSTRSRRPSRPAQSHRPPASGGLASLPESQTAKTRM